MGASLLAMTISQALTLLWMYFEPVGAGLPAMAACEPTILLQMYPVPNVGASLLAMASVQSTFFSAKHSF